MIQGLNFLLLFARLIDGMTLLTTVNVPCAQEIGDVFSTDAVRIEVILCPHW